MPLLKNKVAKALEKTKPETERPSLEATINILSQQLTKPKAIVPLRKKKKVEVESDASSYCSSPHKKERSPNKNIVKNYARAMINFALSDLAVPYLERHVAGRKQHVSLEEFKEFLQSQKEKINSIKTLRELLLITDDDTEKLSAFKEVFRDICETFVKMFSVNWIYSSKLSDKTIHLKYRFKMLRRIRNPELFTYLENFSRRR